MSNMVERVARAIAADINQHQLDVGFAMEADFNGDLQKDWFLYISTARAAIAAMREPSEAMIEAGVRHRLGTSIGADNYWPDDTCALFEKMIDAVLAEGGRK